MLVGSANADDAGVFKINDSTALVQTLDFFTPIVDDPYLFGQIAASNALSDVYAMGGRPVTAMAIAGMPNDLPPQVISEIFKGGADKIAEANSSLVGGHTIKNPEPIYGLSVTGLVHPEHYLSNDQLRDGDILLLTKPLGTGIASSALKAGKASDTLEALAVESMVKLNTPGAEIAEKGLSGACTDVTGFGLLGHLWEMCAASGKTAHLKASTIPALSEEIPKLIEEGIIPGGTRKNLQNVSPHVEFSDTVPEWVHYLLADAQTAGGLLIACPVEQRDEVISIIEAHGSICAAEIGSISTNSPASIKVEW